MCGTTSSTTTSVPSQVLQNYSDVTAQAKNVSSTPYQPYSGELTAGINQGQSDAIGELQSGYGTANPYINSGSGYLDNASAGLGNVQNYLQAASGLGNISGLQNYQNNALGSAGDYYSQGATSAANMNGALGSEANGIGAVQGYLGTGVQTLGGAQQYYGQASGYATPQQFSQGALQQYESPYTQDVVNSTMANAQQQDAIQSQQLSSNAIGQGAYGGDRAGIAQSSLANQQDLANNQTVAGLENQGYSTALGQYNQNQANQFQAASTLQGLGQSQAAAAGLYGTLGQEQGQTAAQYGNLASGFSTQAGLYGNLGEGTSGLASQYGTEGSQQLADAGLYNTLGQTQGTAAQGYGTLAGLSGNLGSIAQSTNTAGASAALQGSTLEQQNQQAQDTANYGQFQNSIQYPFQTTSYLANIDEGIGSNSGSTSSTAGSALSQIAGAGTTALGVLGQIGSSNVSSGYQAVGNGLSNLGAFLTSDERVKDDIAPIGKTFDGQTMYRFRYKGDPAVRTGLMAQEVEKRHPSAVIGLGGIKRVDYDAATAGAAQRGHYARGGGLGLLRSRFDDGGGLAGTAPLVIDLRPGADGVHRAAGLGGIRSRAMLRPADEMPYAMSPLEAEANGYRHPTGAAREALPYNRGRSGFDVGGDTTMANGAPSALFDPTATASSLGSTPSWGTAGLGVAQARSGQQPMPGPGLSAGGAGGVRQAGLGVLASQPQGQQPVAPVPASGFGALGSSAPAGSGATGATGSAPSGNSDENKWLAITAAGLGMMGGTSASGLVNIGQGGLAGLREFTTLQQQDRQNQLAQANFGLDQRKADLTAQQMMLQTEQIKRQMAAASALAGNNGGQMPSGALPSSMAPPSGSVPASSAGTGAAGSQAPAAGASASPSGGGAMSPQPAGSPGVAPASSAGSSDFWSGVPNESNPAWLASQARIATAYGLEGQATQYLKMRDNVLSQGTVIKNGQIVPIPGSIDSSAAKTGADASARAGAESQFDLVQIQPTPGGPTYSVPKSQALGIQAANPSASVVGPGAGSPPGSALTNAAAQNPAIAKQPDYFAERQKAIATDENTMANQFQQRQVSQQRLGALAGLLQTYQTGAFSDVKGDLVAQARAAGIPMSDSDTANPAAFQEFAKQATANVFNDVKSMGGKVLVSEIQGLQKANANPELQPAANAAIIGQGLGLINYENQHYQDYSAWKQQNPYAYDTSSFEIPWAKANPVQGYVDAAGKNIAPLGVPLPSKDKLADGQMYMTKRGPARWNAASQSFTAGAQ